MNQQVLLAKKETVSEISKSIKEAGSLTVVSYQGLTVAEMQELRKTLAKEEASIVVYKNTLVRRALAADELPDLGDLLNGPNGFVFSKDISKGPKALVKFSRFHEALVVKGGLVEGKVIDAAGVKEVSKLPDKNGLIAMFLSCLNAPITKFAATVKAVAEKGQPA
ncbi:MAG: 50S ribosomal protein L10 [Bacilli bacterium]|jgi:large subunit ribosomal protein L10|nr:50S ribosomal protein L10 [Bacilli bacterium]MBO6285921.1 50S ribosomal protein L10 [Bacilli bacterium]